MSTERTLAILGFHKIGAPPPDGWETWFYIPNAIFVNYLNYLQQNNWQVLDVATFLQGLTTPDSLPARSVLLTFDDGYRSMVTNTLPLLRQFNYPAVLFVPTDFIGKSNSFDTDVEPEEPLCTWEELSELEDYGVSIQPHGAAHRRFSELTLPEQHKELHRAKTALETGLKKRVSVFSYPYGDDGENPQLTKQAMQQAGYEAACLYGGGPNVLPIANPYRLTRLAMGPDTDLEALLF